MRATDSRQFPLRPYKVWYNEDRLHLALEKDAPDHRPVEPPEMGEVSPVEAGPVPTLGHGAILAIDSSHQTLVGLRANDGGE